MAVFLFIILGIISLSPLFVYYRIYKKLNESHILRVSFYRPFIPFSLFGPLAFYIIALSLGASNSGSPWVFLVGAFFVVFVTRALFNFSLESIKRDPIPSSVISAINKSGFNPPRFDFYNAFLSPLIWIVLAIVFYLPLIAPCFAWLAKILKLNVL